MEESFWKISFLVLFVVWLFIRMPYKAKAEKVGIKRKKREGIEKFLVFLNYISMMFLPLFVVFTNIIDFANMGLQSWVRWIFLIVYALNLLLFLWCHNALGKNWSVGLEVRENHKLIQIGPYKMVRHPMYTHFWLLIISQGFILDNLIVMLYGLFVWGITYFMRVGHEELLMLEEFGDEYKKYINKTGRLLPKFIKNK